MATYTKKLFTRVDLANVASNARSSPGTPQDWEKDTLVMYVRNGTLDFYMYFDGGVWKECTDVESIWSLHKSYLG